MCGIFGTYGLPDDGRVSRGLDLLAHRGPDGRGEVRIGEATHGHVRLALLDLSDAAAQPFLYGDGVLSYVGELWNYRELRAEMEAIGVTFHTSSDTEVLAAAIDLWGVEEAVARLDGMYAFAWSSPSVDVLVRDRLGKVPLRVVRHGRAFEWASEAKAWGARGGYSTSLPPGSILDLRTGELRRPTALASRGWLGGDDPAGSVLELLRCGVRRRLAADAPVCVLASGGLDSSLILRLAVEERPDVEAFHAYLDPRSEDLRWARVLCSGLGVRLREVKVEPPDARTIAEAVRAVETASKVQTELSCLCLPLARRIAAEGFKACLSGEGADELFGGYGNTLTASSGMDDLDWVVHRRGLVAGMAGRNFARCNKAFMAGGVECRLPFMERGLVDLALSGGKVECPPGKELLKLAAELVLPRELVRRQKETFQGGAGLSAAAEVTVGDVAALCRRVALETFGRIPEG